MLTNALSDRLAARLPFYYGYVMIPIAMMIQICTCPGQTFAISAFTPRIRESLELSDSRLSLAYMLGTFLAALPLSLMGPLSDRMGLRLLTVVTVLSLSAACWFAAHVNGFASLLIAFFLLRFLGQGSLSLLGANSIAMWFRSRIGRVSAVMSIGGAIAFAWIPQWISDSITQRGWRETYQAIGLLVVVIMLPLMLILFRDRPEDIGQSVDGVVDQEPGQSGKDIVHQHLAAPELSFPEALRGRSFYILAITNCFWAMAGTGVVFYLFALCQDRGLASHVAPDLFKTLGLSMLVMQLIGGVLADVVPLHRLLGCGTTMLAMGLWCAWSGHTTSHLHGFAGLFGAGQGLLLAVGSAVWVRYYGRIHLGTIRGTAWSLTVAGSGCGPLVMGVTRDRFGAFDPAIGMFFVGMCCLAVVAWWATPPKTGL